MASEQQNQEKLMAPEEIEITVTVQGESSDGVIAAQANPNFNEELITKYPKSNRKLNLHVCRFGIDREGADKEKNGQTIHISPHGIEFRTSDQFVEGALVKIQIRLPDYWARKQQFVEYGRVDSPTEFRVLAKVVRTEEVGKRGKKQLVLAKTLIMDSVDEKVLKTFLQEN